MVDSLLLETVTRLPRLSLGLLIAAPVVYLATTIIYNLYFHPLAKYPGPLICRASNLPWVRGSLFDTRPFVIRTDLLSRIGGNYPAVYKSTQQRPMQNTAESSASHQMSSHTPIPAHGTTFMATTAARSNGPGIPCVCPRARTPQRAS